MRISQAERGRVEPVLSMDIERLLIWTYQDQQADWIVGRGGLYIATGGYDSTIAVASRAALGCRIQGGGYARLTIHVDAETVHDQVKALPAALIGMVIRHAKAGTRPDWMPDAQPRPIPIFRKKDRPQMVYWDVAKKKPAYCLLAYDPEPKHIAFMRDVWLAWWDALDRLAADLDGMLERKVLRPPFRREPWLVGKSIDREVKL
jgi:hypothetical protein